jgi:hypothetical protein
MFTINFDSLAFTLITEGNIIAFNIYLIYLFFDSKNEPGRSNGNLSLKGKLYCPFYTTFYLN